MCFSVSGQMTPFPVQRGPVLCDPNFCLLCAITEVRLACSVENSREAIPCLNQEGYRCLLRVKEAEEHMYFIIAS